MLDLVIITSKFSKPMVVFREQTVGRECSMISQFINPNVTETKCEDCWVHGESQSGERSNQIRTRMTLIKVDLIKGFYEVIRMRSGRQVKCLLNERLPYKGSNGGSHAHSVHSKKCQSVERLH